MDYDIDTMDNMQLDVINLYVGKIFSPNYSNKTIKGIIVDISPDRISYNWIDRITNARKSSYSISYELWESKVSDNTFVEYNE